MSDKNLILTSTEHSDLRLRTIDENDIENLRNWKNANKNSFFLNHDITSEQQKKWYQNFSSRQYDYMFIVEQKIEDGWEGIGCMGFRKLEDEGCIDGYNIIRAKKIEPASFTMSEAFQLMLTYAASCYLDLPIRVKVLSGNPAVEWYQKNQFSIISDEKDYYLMEINKDSLLNIHFIKNTK